MAQLDEKRLFLWKGEEVNFIKIMAMQLCGNMKLRWTD